jgi:hypothetical protein
MILAKLPTKYSNMEIPQPQKTKT